MRWFDELARREGVCWAEELFAIWQDHVGCVPDEWPGTAEEAMGRAGSLSEEAIMPSYLQNRMAELVSIAAASHWQLLRHEARRPPPSGPARIHNTLSTGSGQRPTGYPQHEGPMPLRKATEPTGRTARRVG